MNLADAAHLFKAGYRLAAIKQIAKDAKQGDKAAEATIKAAAFGGKKSK